MYRLRNPRAWLLPAYLGLVAVSLTAQVPPAPQLPADSADPLVGAFRWRNIGNANLIGRISAIDALESDFTHVIVGSASGGVFKSVNAGTSWTPIFDNYGAASIGDVAIFQMDPDIIWIGTGEECGRNSAAWGDGVYKSTDGGKTFTNVGLKDTFNIGSVVVHPRSQHRLCRGRGVDWGQERARFLQDRRRRQDVDEADEQSARRRDHRRDRSAHGSVEPEHVVRRVLAAHAHRVEA
jgi:hypothetical protein